MFANYFKLTYMPVFFLKSDFDPYYGAISRPEHTIGFIPTMGALHQGHLSLMQRSIKENKTTVVSIFVNPTQFNNEEDLLKYPRNLELDIEKIYNLNSNIVIFAPSIEEIYTGKPILETFDFEGLDKEMEGSFRPGHFNGVATVVKRLFEIVKPTNAYFGEKDFQQLQIIKKLVVQNNMNINIIGCPIYRDKNNLAMSSRNEHLSNQEKKEASIIYKTLLLAKKKFEKYSAKKTLEWVEKYFEKQSKFKLEYFQIADETNLIACNRKNKDKKYRAFIAVFINNIRLIDSISLN